MKNSFLQISLVLVCALLMTSCQKEITSGDINGVAGLIVTMTDAATGNYDKVNIDIQGVEITSVSAGAIMLNPNEGIYNLLDYSSGRDTIIGAGGVKNGNISQVRLILGTKNTIVVAGETFPLILTVDDPGLKVPLQNFLEAGHSYTLLLDFDTAQSVVESNGSYILKPFIRVVDPAFDRSVMGPG